MAGLATSAAALPLATLADHERLRAASQTSATVVRAPGSAVLSGLEAPLFVVRARG